MFENVAEVIQHTNLPEKFFSSPNMRGIYSKAGDMPFYRLEQFGGTKFDKRDKDAVDLMFVANECLLDRKGGSPLSQIKIDESPLYDDFAKITEEILNTVPADGDHVQSDGKQIVLKSDDINGYFVFNSPKRIGFTSARLLLMSPDKKTVTVITLHGRDTEEIGYAPSIGAYQTSVGDKPNEWIDSEINETTLTQILSIVRDSIQQRHMAKLQHDSRLAPLEKPFE